MAKNKYFIFLYGFILNPLLNLPVFFWIDPTYDNLSHIGTSLHHPWYLILWAISSAWGLYFLSRSIWKKERIKMARSLHLLFCLGMVVSCCIPYSPKLPGFVNDLHVWMAILCVSGFILEWISTIFSPAFYQRSYRTFLMVLIGWFAFCFLEITRAGSINGLSEVLFSIGVDALLAFYWSKE